jgi:hypothetical protein
MLPKVKKKWQNCFWKLAELFPKFAELFPKVAELFDATGRKPMLATVQHWAYPTINAALTLSRQYASYATYVNTTLHIV